MAARPLPPALSRDWDHLMFSASVRGGQARHREQCPREGPHYRGCFWKSAPEEELPLRPRSWAGLLFHARRSPSGGLLGRGFGALCSHLGCSAAPGGSLQVPPTAWLPASATPSAAQGPLIPPALGNGARFREQWDFPFFGPARTPKLSTHTHAPREGAASSGTGSCEEVHVCAAGFVPTEADSGKARGSVRQPNPLVSGLGGQRALTGLG